MANYGGVKRATHAARLRRSTAGVWHGTAYANITALRLFVLATAVACAAGCQPGSSARYDLHARVEEAVVDLRPGHSSLAASVVVSDVRLLTSPGHGASAGSSGLYDVGQSEAGGAVAVCARVVTVDLPDVNMGASQNVVFHPVVVLSSAHDNAVAEVLELYATESSG